MGDGAMCHYCRRYRCICGEIGSGRDTSRAVLLRACQMAYRKHVLDDESIGWDELTEVLGTALAEAMGDRAFQAWLPLD